MVSVTPTETRLCAATAGAAAAPTNTAIKAAPAIFPLIKLFMNPP
jgi:hypothetical protein